MPLSQTPVKAIFCLFNGKRYVGFIQIDLC